MQNNLEGISFDEVVNEKGMSYADFRQQLFPRYSKVWKDAGIGYFFLIFFSTLFLWMNTRFHFYWWLFIIPFSIAIGYIAAYIALFIHEAGHFNIHPDKKKNDRMATLLLCLPFGLSMKSYRKIHWQHHLHLGTPQDTEVSYFNGLSKLFILETLTGFHLIRTIVKKEKNGLLTKEQLSQSRAMLLAGFLLHSTILVISLIAGHWAFAICWLIAFGIFFPFFATIRQLLEHRDELAKTGTDYTKQPHGKVSRLFVHTLLSSSFGAAGFTRHLIHHWDPQVSYTRLDDIETFLLSCPKTASIISTSRTTYFSTWKKLVSSS